MLSDLYNERILALAADIPRLGRLDAPDGSATHRSRLCGSQVTVDVTVDDAGKVGDFGHDVRACALGQASSALMADLAVGADAAELADVEAAVQAMLKEDGPAPEGRWAELRVLEPVRAHKSRHASVMLTFSATREAVERATQAAAA